MLKEAVTELKWSETDDLTNFCALLTIEARNASDIISCEKNLMLIMNKLAETNHIMTNIMDWLNFCGYCFDFCRAISSSKYFKALL